MTRVMYDAVSPNQIPRSATMVAGYVDGLYANMNDLRAQFPHAVHVGIAVSSHTDDGQVLDVEQGDATPQGAVSWVLMRRRAGADPSVYCSDSVWSQVRDAFASAKVPQPHYWIAYWDDMASIPMGAVAKQYKNGTGYDTSVVEDYWPGVDTGVPTPPPPPVPPHGGTYRVQSGDSLSSIAAAHNMTLAQIEALNPQIRNFDLIYPGQEVFITGTVPVRRYYLVQNGDNLSDIAASHGMTLAEIERLNPQIHNFDLIYPGERIFL